MDGLELAVLLAATVALLLFAAYLSSARRERGQDPYYAREVFLYRPPGAALTLADARRAAASLGAEVATRGQVAVYAAAGGQAPGCGFVAEGLAARLLPSPAAGVTADGCDPAENGVWLYGPKPRHLYPGVAPFAGGCWFQPR